MNSPHVASLLPPKGAPGPLGRPGGSRNSPHVASLLPPKGAPGPLGRPGGSRA